MAILVVEGLNNKLENIRESIFLYSGALCKGWGTQGNQPES